MPTRQRKLPSSHRISHDHRRRPSGRSFPFDDSTFGTTYSELYPTQVSGPKSARANNIPFTECLTSLTMIDRAKMPDLICHMRKREAPERRSRLDFLRIYNFLQTMCFLEIIYPRDTRRSIGGCGSRSFPRCLRSTAGFRPLYRVGTHHSLQTFRDTVLAGDRLGKLVLCRSISGAGRTLMMSFCSSGFQMLLVKISAHSRVHLI